MGFFFSFLKNTFKQQQKKQINSFFLHTKKQNKYLRKKQKQKIQNLEKKSKKNLFFVF